jgi:predicted nucleic acid-binding Zn ribbon protein
VRKIYSNVGVVFKGSGFYKTDSKVKSEPKAKTESKVEKALPPKSDT